MWKKYGRAGQATDDNIIRRMRIACWIPKATDTHSEYVIIIALPLHLWFREWTSMLRYTYIACLISFLVGLLLPTHCRCRGLLLRLITLSDTHTYTHRQTHTRQDSSGREIDPSHRPLPDNAQHNIHKRHTSMPTAGFEPAIPANEQPQTLASDRAATGIGHWTIRRYILSFWQIP